MSVYIYIHTYIYTCIYSYSYIFIGPGTPDGAHPPPERIWASPGLPGVLGNGPTAAPTRSGGYQDGPRGPQESAKTAPKGPRRSGAPAKRPRRAPRRPKRLPRGLQEGPRGLQEDLQESPKRREIEDFRRFLMDFDVCSFPALRRPTTNHEASIWSQDRPRGPQDGPQTVQESPKTAADGPKMASKTGQDSPK